MLFLYVAILVLVALTSYTAISEQSNVAGTSMASFQASLSGFYLSILSIITTAVLALAPVLAASPIVAEYERRSMEIVLATPITPKYFLLGKYLGACRQLLLLLFLSLPITAVGVAFGGSTWQELLQQYLAFFLQGALAMAIASIIAVGTKKVAPTVFVTYAILFFASMLGSISGAATFFGGPAATAPSGAPVAVFFSLLLPYSGTLSVGTVTLVSTWEVPNWIFAIVLAAIGVKLCLLGAGSVLSKDGAVEIKSLRIHGLVSLSVVSGLYVTLIAPLVTGPLMGSMGSGGSGGALPPGTISGVFMGLAFPVGLTALFCVGTLCCFGLIDERKTKEDGLFNLRRTLVGRPSSGLPYLFALCVAGLMPLWIFWVNNFRSEVAVMVTHSAWLFAAMAFYWALARLVSCGFTTAVDAKKSLGGAVALLVVIVPLILSWFDGTMLFTTNGAWAPWVQRYPLSPYVELDLEMIKIFVLVVLTVGLVYLSEKLKRRKMERLGLA